MATVSFFMEDNSLVHIEVPDDSPLANGRYSAYYIGPIVADVVIPAKECRACGGKCLSVPDHEGVVDCLTCGIFTFPDHVPGKALTGPAVRLGTCMDCSGDSPESRNEDCKGCSA